MINRKKVLKRHSPLCKELNLKAPLSLGNGRCCFTSDFTGLQTFFDEYASPKDAFPLCTMAEWGWHSYPFSPEAEAALRLTPFDTYGRTVYYAADDKGQEELFKSVRVNAHKFHLGKIAFELSDNKISLENSKPVKQYLSLWEGVLFSEFKLNNINVKSETFICPENDALYAKITSPLLKNGKLQITITFPYGSHRKTGADFSVPERHSTRIIKNSFNYLEIERKLDTASYKVIIAGKGFNSYINGKNHIITLIPYKKNIDFSIKFIDLSKDYRSEGMETRRNRKKECSKFWKKYWSTGGFIDFSGSTDSRADELERRIVLSQYLAAIQSRGNLPPAETGLSCNSWYGKFHMEMLFWHIAHFALWGKEDEILKALDYYKKMLPLARETASKQGYRGARWPKMCDPSGKNTPSSIAVLLIWQQPHPIILIELYMRSKPSTEILNKYRGVITETAEFIKSFVHFNKEKNCFELGPPYIPVQERHDPKTVKNAVFELEYFRWALYKTDEFLKLSGELKQNESRYAQIAEKLALPSHSDGVYPAHENCPDTFGKLPFYTDHPSMLMTYGVLNSDKIDLSIMSATLDKVLEKWDKNTFYGWDFPMIAMTACRLGRYNDAIDILLTESPKNTWLENGHNKQYGDDALPCYLPGNGALLLAIAMLAAGYGDKKSSSFPEGFKVKVEKINAYI